MKNNFYSEIVVAVAFTIVAGLLINPFHVWMPSMAHAVLCAAAVIVFGIFGIFVLRETPGDEREDAHRMFAGRAAYLAGAGTLLLALISQTINESVDPWVVGALLVMVLAKVGAHLYSARYR